MLREAVTTAAAAVALTVERPDGTPLVLRWGTQLDLRHITASRAAEVEDGDGQISEARLAGYIAKYATKGTGATEGTDRPIRDGAHIGTSTSPRTTAGSSPPSGSSAASRSTSRSTCAAGRTCSASAATSSPRAAATPPPSAPSAPNAAPGACSTPSTGSPATPTTQATIPPDLDTVTVINDWRLVGIGHHNHAERELAMAIAERHRTHRTTRREG